jgi:hypothetical protein
MCSLEHLPSCPSRRKLCRNFSTRSRDQERRANAPETAFKKSDGPSKSPQGLSFQRRPEKDVFPAKWVPLRYKHLLDEFPIPTRGGSPGRPFLHPEKLGAALLMVETGLWPTKAPSETGYAAQRSTVKSKRGITPEP